MKIGFIGIGKMGSQMVPRLLKARHEVVVADLNRANVQAVAAQGAEPAANREAMVRKLGSPAVIWLMIPAAAVEEELKALLKVLPQGSIVIDGGNSDFRQTRQQAAKCQEQGVQLLDVGTSGGVFSSNDGFSLTIGGDEQTYKTLEPIFLSLAELHGFAYCGPSGAGHYIKMVHNAIEYGVMEAYAEGYHLLKDGQDYPQLNLADIAKVWQRGSIVAGTLNNMAADILAHNPQLQGIEGYVAESGEARWAMEVADAQNIKLDAIKTALDKRLASQRGEVNFATKLLAAMRNAFGGHPYNKAGE